MADDDQGNANLIEPANDAASSSEPKNTPAKPKHSDKNAAIELIRRKVDAAYGRGQEPDMKAEVEEVKQAPKADKLSKHQRFIKDLTSSSLSLTDQRAAWHRYYQELPDDEKHAVWQEFYQAYGSKDDYEAYAAGSKIARSRSPRRPTLFANKRRTAASSSPRRQPPKQLHSLLVGLASGGIVIVIILFSFFNERFIAPFIQPSRALTNAPLITGSSVGPDSEIIIPKINVEIPVVYDVNSIDETTLDSALENGVVNYPDTAEPGQNGNVVIVGHSSNNIFNKGHYKFAFVLLSRLDNGDTFYLQKDGKRYTYQVYKKEIIKPDNVAVLGPADRAATASLITCDPPGTSINRLVVTGEQIDPSPNSNSAAASGNKAVSQAKTVPGNSPSLWSRLWH